MRTIRIRKGEEARQGSDGVWRLWRSEHWSRFEEHWSHVMTEIPGQIWVCIDADRSLSALAERHRGLSPTKLKHTLKTC